MTPEAKIKEKIKRILKKHGVWYAMPRGGPYGKAGVPDFICCHCGIFIAIEAKARNNIATDAQQKQIEEIRVAGGLANVVREENLNELDSALGDIAARFRAAQSNRIAETAASIN